MNPLIIGTAGHIDHGKTALIKALTGQDTDRLKEEKERGISIDLGFAYLDLPGLGRAGIVDVPGHERFIRNMLAGAHGMDLVLFTIAADDGVMPQSQEHLDILHVLGVRRGIFAITKTDLVEPARVAAVREEIEILTLDTTLEGSPVVPVSSTTGEGLDALREEIARQLASYTRPERPGYFRLPVDRAFVLHGHGVVVTGTVVAGRVGRGDAVRVLPGGELVRVRGLEVHGEPVPEGRAGQRVALNLAGLERGEVGRGHVVAHEKLHLATRRLDALIELRPSARLAVPHHGRVRVHLGTAEVLGKAVLLDRRARLGPRERAWAQLVLDEPVLALRGDRLILRDQTARWTLGGGQVVHPLASRHRRGDEPGLLERLGRLRGENLEKAAEAAIELEAGFACSLERLYHVLNRREEAVVGALSGSPDLLPIPEAGRPEAYAVAGAWEGLRAAARERLEAFHRQSPLAPGMEMEQLREQLPFSLSPRVFRWVLERLSEEGTLVREESLVKCPGHQATLGPAEQELAVRAESLLRSGGFTPPDVRQLADSLGVPRRKVADVLAVLEVQGRVERIGPDLYYSRASAEEARRLLVSHLHARGEVSAATFRDLIGGSRKYSIAFLDHCDRTGLTVRVGDVRKLRAG